MILNIIKLKCTLNAKNEWILILKDTNDGYFSNDRFICNVIK